MVMLTDTGGGKDFEPVSIGPKAAICDMFVDLGMQEGGKFGPKHQLYFRFQVPEERIQYEKDGQEYDLPKVIGRMFTASLSEKSHLRPFLESWRGKAFTADELRGFDPVAVAGAPALINVVHEPGQKNGKAVTYANMASIMPLPKGMSVKLEGEVIIHDDDHDNYDKLPKWLQERLDNQVDDEPSKADNIASTGASSAFDNDLDDDVPF